MTDRYPWVRAAAAMGGIAVVLVALVVETDRFTEAIPGAVATPPSVVGSADEFPYAVRIDADAVAEYRRRHTSFSDPVPLGDSAAVNGDPGFAAALQAGPGAGPTAFTVLIRNIGDQPFDGSFAAGGAWLESDRGETFYPPQVRPLSSGTVTPGAIGPRAEIVLEVAFTVPAHVRPARLVLSLKLGQFYPYTQWDLPLPAGK